MSKRLINPSPSLLGRAQRAALRGLGVHPEDRQAVRLDLSGRRALCVATNRGTLDVGVPTGVFGSELTVPYYCFLDAGMQVALASPAGGLVPVEPLSMRVELRTAADDRMLDDDRLRAQLANSFAVDAIDFTGYDLIYFAGGWGAAFDLGQSEALGRAVSAAAAAGRVLGGICHGPLGLLRARRPDGQLLVKDRRITAVTDQQVRQLGVSITPLHPESALREAGARYECRHHPVKDFFANHLVVDGDLITGQNQNAGPMVARLMMQRALAKPVAQPSSRTTLSASR
ncbi:MAG: type 1 glutamine amidotransferase domain-containing protein [Candidatus Eisenbacteria bacterium]